LGSRQGKERFGGEKGRKGLVWGIKAVGKGLEARDTHRERLWGQLGQQVKQDVCDCMAEVT